MMATAAEIMALGDKDETPGDNVADKAIIKAPVLDVKDGGVKDHKDSANYVDPLAAEKAAQAAKDKAAADAKKIVDDKVAADKKIADEAVAKAKADQEWPVFENEYAQSAVDLIKESGVTIEESRAMFGKAMDTGDISTIDWKQVEAKIGKQKTLLVKAGIETYHAGEYTEVVATVDYGHETMGGKEQWEKVAAWAQTKEKADPKFKATLDGIRKGIRANGELARISIDKLKSVYESDPKNSALTVKMVGGDTRAVAVGDPLSRADYVSELHKAHNTLRGAALNQATALLDARRREGRRLGK